MIEILIFILGFIVGSITIIIWSVLPYYRLKIGDYVYVKPTMVKGIIDNKLLDGFTVLDMRGRMIHYGMVYQFPKSMLIKVENETKI